jgi:basic membrane lipoprotein Med (substrate-binding protein (PBP1-ABC) superfamily)
VAPDVVLASAVMDIPRCFLLVARRVQEGRFEARPMEYGMAEQVVSLVWNPELVGSVPEPVRQELEDLTRRITSGELDVPHLEF